MGGIGIEFLCDAVWDEMGVERKREEAVRKGHRGEEASERTSDATAAYAGAKIT